VDHPAHLINLVTTCTSREDFIKQFQPYLDDVTLFIPSKLPLTAGHPVEFSIALKDTRPMLEGRGEVVEVSDKATATAPRAGVRIRVSEMTAESQPIRSAILLANRPARATAKTSLFAHPVRTIAPAARPGDRPPEAGPLGDISTQALTFYIECNLSAAEAEDGFLEQTEATVRAPPPPVPAGALRDSLIQPALADVDLYEPARAFDPRTLAWKLRRVLPIAGACVATVVVCWVVWGRGGQPPPRVAVVRTAAVAPAPPSPAPPPPAPPPPKATPPAPAKAVAMAPAAAAPAPAEAPAPQPAPAPAPRAAAPAEAGRGCTATITSHPNGAVVSIGRRKLGATPLASVEVPCEKQVITLTRPRYSTTTASIDAEPGAPAATFVKMNRPPAQLVLTSSPPNATFMVNGTVVGHAPQHVPVMRFERHRIEASLPGHRPWGQVLYLAKSTMKVTAVLKPRSGR
jgi:hypothetical protein